MLGRAGASLSSSSWFSKYRDRGGRFMAADLTPAPSSRPSASPSKTVVGQAAFPVLTCLLAALVSWLVCRWVGMDSSLTALVLVLWLIVEIPCERLLYRINEVRERLRRIEEAVERMSKLPPP
jgi:hypothetical protein